ncbi:NmrA family NAD(P)-binding protein [Pedobacter jejuensis]|uniref:NAD-dependent epimerase/dehydratase family protein n=1 Tax=Pedobacter jejuensis TaxID=1268550 RepID=A0A3N0BX63_9SPHI|nr:NAD(P)H-binding protein [Pedobacter jejuensis]RNL54228.1 NAD-dependent epimerase/dehydratase family protein [Pedobacter jejuensis]
MKIIITGSLGHISKPLTIALVQKGHDITVISSKPEKQKEIESLGANAAIGSLHDVEFLSKTFSGADAVYTMVPPGNYFDPNLDLLAYYKDLGKNYAHAIKNAGVKRVVNLSTIGGNLAEGNGILAGAHYVELILNELPADVAITHMRPNSFYYNLLSYIEMIKFNDAIVANYGGDDIIPWVSPVDIAAAIAEELITPFSGRKARSVGSEDLSGNETARILGEAIGKPDLKWILVSDEETLKGLISIGMNPEIASGLVEMYAALHSGLLAEDYYKNKPAVMGKVKMTDYAKEFALAFNQ